MSEGNAAEGSGLGLYVLMFFLAHSIIECAFPGTAPFFLTIVLLYSLAPVQTGGEVSRIGIWRRLGWQG